VVPAGDPKARAAENAWTDSPVPGLKDIWYRIVALDNVDPLDAHGGGGNISQPSPAIRARAYDLTPPEPPLITNVEWVRIDGDGGIHAWSDPVPAGSERYAAVRLDWNSADAETKLLVQFQSGSDSDFTAVSGWLTPGTMEFIHKGARTFEPNTYRLKVVNGAGNTNTVWHSVILASST